MIMSSRINQILLRNTTKSLQISNLNSKRGSLWVRSKLLTPKKSTTNVPVIENLNITIPKGSLFTLLGPSGCGKTTLLRMIAGFNSIEGGEFYFDDTKINNMEPSKRNIGMVFQNYAIFPHLTVRDNVAFGLKQKKVPKEELIQQTNKYLELMQIAQYADRKPDKLRWWTTTTCRLGTCLSC